MPRELSPLASADTLIDIHCHRFSGGGQLQILSLDTHELAGHTAGIAAKFLSLSGQNPGDSLPDGCYFSLGIHPWFIDNQDIDTAFQTLAAFHHHPKLLAIGECGLDKCINTPMARQIQVFARQFELSKRFGKPPIIHCVRAFAELLQLKKRLAPSQACILHGFAGNPALAAQLIQHGCYLSFGKALLQAGSRAGQTLLATPIERLFLETDADDVSIDTIYAAAATIRGIELADLRRQIHTNFSNVFLND